MPFEQERTIYAFMMGYGNLLLESVDAADALVPMCPGGHHPMWVIGHLATVAHDWSKRLGGPGVTTFDDAWRARLARGLAHPTTNADAADYPPFAQVIAAWHEAHTAFDAAAARASDDAIAQPSRGPVSQGLPTVRDFVAFLLTAHEGMHLSQLSTWRRTRGLPPLF